MDSNIKIDELKKCIWDTLSSLINNDYILTDLPYHQNLGDILIWEGEKTFCGELSYNCLGISNPVTFTFPELPSNVIILLNGGGNFGDLWRSSQDFRLDIIKHYPNNRIIIFPQSIWYDNENLIQEDAEVFSQHQDLHICVRDRFSYDFLKQNFGCKNIYLIPDMAFYIKDTTLQQYRYKAKENSHLYLKRTDKEFSASEQVLVGEAYTVHDWPTIEKIPVYAVVLIKLCGLIRRIPRKCYIRKILSKIANNFANAIFRKRMLDSAFKFISGYAQVTTTRLHAMILGILLYKPVFYIDNLTGKVSGYADAWLHDLPTVKPLKADEK